MAQQIGGATLTGKVGAQVFGIGGTVRRLRVAPNSRSTKQVGARSRLSALSTQFRALPVGDQQVWNDAALNYPMVNRAGISRRMTGSQLYVKCNGLALAITDQLGKTTPAQIALPSPPVTVSDTAMISSNETLLVSFTGTITSNERLVIYASRAQSNGTGRATSMKLIACLAAADITTAPGPPPTYKSDLSSEWSAVYGNCLGGVTIYLEAYIINVNELVKRPAGSCSVRADAF